MSKLISSRASVVIAATLFAVATWLNASIEAKQVPTHFTLTQPTAELPTVAQNR
jgi:hypothetical protein